VGIDPPFDVMKLSVISWSVVTCKLGSWFCGGENPFVGVTMEIYATHGTIFSRSHHLVSQTVRFLFFNHPPRFLTIRVTYHLSDFRIRSWRRLSPTLMTSR